MANTYTQMYLHLVIVVSGRLSLIPHNHKTELFQYISGIIRERGHKPLCINGMPDHVHIFLGLNPEESVSSLAKEIKRCSTLFMNQKGWYTSKFSWQSGYAAFTYSHSHIDRVIHYIMNQEKHHERATLRIEYEEMLKKNQVAYDEKYIFKDVM